ncbi:MAG: diaminopimelate epimerase [Spirochaetes bacterium]|nr:diaminopimelate epimerase [Spirochaetota bacterium]
MPFIKMEGAGNDYVYLDLLPEKSGAVFEGISWNDLARTISDRHFGVGSDGLVLVRKGESSRFGMRMFNADGSEAEMCGNAIRCVAKLLTDKHYETEESFSIDTRAGKKTVAIKDRLPGGITLVEVDMGEPILKSRDIPVAVDTERAIDVTISGRRGTAVSMGNPHFVVFVDRITDDLVRNEGPLLEHDPMFPNRTNVEFARVVDDSHLEMRVWERGSGETLACGTGACATAVAAVLEKRASREVNVSLLGGELSISWRDDNHVYLKGPARETFTGVYHYTR